MADRSSAARLGAVVLYESAWNDDMNQLIEVMDRLATRRRRVRPKTKAARPAGATRWIEWDFDDRSSVAFDEWKENDQLKSRMVFRNRNGSTGYTVLC